MADNNTYSGTQEDAATAASVNDVDPSYLAKVLRYLTTPNAPPPGMPGGATFGGNKFGGATYGDPNAASGSAFQRQKPDVPDVSVTVPSVPPVPEWLLNPKVPFPSPSINANPGGNKFGGNTFGDPNAAAGSAFRRQAPDVPDVSINVPMPPTAGTTARAPQPNTAPVSSMAGADQMLSQTNPGLPPAMGPSPPVDPRGAMPSPQPAIGRGPRTPMRPADITNLQIGAAIDKFGGEAGNFLENIFGGGMPVAARAATSPSPAINQRPLISPPSPAAAAPSPGPQAAPPSAAAGAPPRADAAQAGPAFPMGGGPGVTVPHDQAAAVAGGAGHLGTQVANDPNTVNGIIQDLRTKGYANNPENFWLALAQAGFATMASRSPFALQAIGEGASAGMDAYAKMRSARMGQLTTAADLAAKQQQLQQERAYQNRMATVSEKEADVREKLLPGQILRDTAYANMLIPARVQHYQNLDAARGGPSNKAEEAAFKNEYDRQFSALKANPLSTLPANPEEQAKQAQQMADEAYQAALAHPERWQNGGLPPAATTAGASDGRPAGAVKPVPAGVKDGTTGGGGKYVAKNGWWVPLPVPQ